MQRHGARSAEGIATGNRTACRARDHQTQLRTTELHARSRSTDDAIDARCADQQVIGCLLHLAREPSHDSGQILARQVASSDQPVHPRLLTRKNLQVASTDLRQSRQARLQQHPDFAGQFVAQIQGLRPSALATQAQLHRVGQAIGQAQVQHLHLRKTQGLDVAANQLATKGHVPAARCGCDLHIAAAQARQVFQRQLQLRSRYRGRQRRGALVLIGQGEIACSRRADALQL